MGSLKNFDLETEIEELRTSLKAKNAWPMWKVEDAVAKNRPNAKAVPFLWNFKSFEKDLHEAGRLVSEKEATRRVAMLVNPAFEPGTPYTTDTIYTGYQLIKAGEIAPAHRHVAFAMRFGLGGENIFTSVGGEKLPLEFGDLILTPSLEWHYHGNEGNDSGIWLDCLDIPVHIFGRMNFLQIYPEPTVPDREVPRSPFKHSWRDTKAILDRDPSPHATHHYDYKNLPYASRTLGAQMERINKGYTTAKSGNTCSFVYCCKQGRGYSTIKTIKQPLGHDAEPTIVHWGPRDVFAVPGWSEVEHTVEEGEDAYLFAFNDRPLMESLGFYRTMEEMKDLKGNS